MFLQNKAGFLICVLALIIYFLLRLPLNLSVVCANENQGFSFVFGQSLLNWGELADGRGIVFVLLYSVILKLFGFNTWAIIAIHWVETLIVLASGFALYHIIRIVINNDFFAGLGVLLWVILISTPIGYSPLKIEIQSHYNLDGEILCVLFSVISILFLVLSCFEQINSYNKSFPVLAAIFATFSLMSKANGGVILIATLTWFFYIVFFKRGFFSTIIPVIKSYIISTILSLLFFNVILYCLKLDLLYTWKDYFFVGSYNSDYLSTFNSLASSFLKFITRHKFSLSNIILFLTTIILLFYGLIKCTFIKKNEKLYLFWSLVSIWGFGNIAAIIAPGFYQPYYYQLIWPVISIVMILGFYELFSYLKNTSNKNLVVLISIIITIFFAYRIAVAIPAHYQLTKELIDVSVFNQPQSFQDPVLQYNKTPTKRLGFLQVADAINNLLPDKTSTFYIFNFHKEGISAFNATSYIYAKRFPPTSVADGLLGIPNIVESKIKTLKRDLQRRKPEILVVSEDIDLQQWQIQHVSPFINWFNGYISDNYMLETTFNIAHIHSENKTEHFNIYRINK